MFLSVCVLHWSHYADYGDAVLHVSWLIWQTGCQLEGLPQGIAERVLNTLRTELNGCHLADDIFNHICQHWNRWNLSDIGILEMVWHQKWFLTHWGILTHWGRMVFQEYRPSLVQIMACHLFGATPLSNVGLLLIWPLGMNFNEIWIEIRLFPLQRINLNVLPAKRQPFSLSFNVLITSL